MNDSSRRRWLRVAILVGLIYFAAGIISVELAAAAASHRMLLFWRWSAFIICAVLFAGHIAYEHFRLYSQARAAASHTSVAVALGAFVLALAANIHELGLASAYRPRMLIALVAWPLITAVPAFIVALVVAAVLNLTRTTG